MSKDFTVELTTKRKILEVNNSMCHNYYYLQHGRIYNSNKSRMRRFKFVFWFDIFDVMEYFEKDSITQKDLSEYANEIAWNTIESCKNNIKSYNDCQKFYDWCNETINNFNKE